ncbi:hypothetical protein V6Z11_A09G058800 [Gossypium hirsutum]
MHQFPVLPSLIAVSVLLMVTPVIGYRPWPHLKPNSSDLTLGSSKKFEGSSEFVQMRYHMGPVLTANISHTVHLGEEKNDRFYSHGKKLTRLSIQSVIKSAVTASTKPLPINPSSGLFLLLTSDDVYVQDFCGQVCGFHYFTFPSIVGYTLPYAWVGNSAKLCPGVCAYPFAVPKYMTGFKPLKSPNGDVGVDGMISVIGHEIAELATNPLVNAWYAGQDPVAPVEIADLCEGIYGTGGGGSYTGQLFNDKDGATFNMNGIRRSFPFSE